MVVSVNLGFMLCAFIGQRLSDECLKRKTQGHRHHHEIYIYIYNSSIIDIEHYLIIPQNLVHQ